MSTLLVGIGGALGAIARFMVGRQFETRGTLVVNVCGSFALGALVAFDPGASALALLGTGFCGAFTTFSSVAVAVASHAEAGDRRAAVGMAVGHLLGAIAAILAGGALAVALA